MIRAVGTPMRLDSREIETIRAAAREVFGDRATGRLFGSRARDTLRGGDIDLVVEVDRARPPLPMSSASATESPRPSKTFASTSCFTSAAPR